jgi:calcium-dependent protein kinase
MDWAQITKQVLLALNYWHKNHIVHRDLKPENILFESKEDDSYIKLVDFGFAITFDPKKGMKDVLGTPLFIAPEIIAEKKYNSKADIWSLGVVVYYLIWGYPPFDGDDRAELFSKIKSGKFSFNGKIWKWVSQDCQEFIMLCLTKDAKLRPSADRLMKHKWIVDTPQTKLEDSMVKSSLENLGNYSLQNKFQKGIIQFLTYTSSHKEEMKKLSEVFKAIDINNDGKLSIEEISIYIKKVMGSWNAEEVKEIYEKIDTDKSGYVDYSEFLSATINKRTLLRQKELKQAFQYLDKDGSGDISKQEIKKVFHTKCTKRTEEEWEEIITELDKDGNDKISFDEFMAAMRKVIEPEVTYNWTILASPVNKKSNELKGFLQDSEEEKFEIEAME